VLYVEHFIDTGHNKLYLLGTPAWAAAVEAGGLSRTLSCLRAIGGRLAAFTRQPLRLAERLA
jgi:hypothetical protein